MSEENLKISGLHYVRELKDYKGERCFYILVSPENKPVKEVFEYLLYRKKYGGDSLNTIKRKTYNLAYFYDFILIKELNFVDLNYSHLYGFITKYLKKVDSIRVDDCIERSMFKALPYKSFDEYSNLKYLSLKNTSFILDVNSIRKIVIDTKQFLEFLVLKKKLKIDLNNIFKVVSVKSNGNVDMLSYCKPVKTVYSANGLFKAAKVPFQNNNRCKPIEETVIFENDEELSFKKALEQENPMDQLFLICYFFLEQGLANYLQHIFFIVQ